MSEWFGALPALAAAAFLSLLPGLPIGLALRLRGFVLLPVSAAASFAVSGVASVVAPFLGFGWSPLLPIAFGVILAAPALLGWRWFRPASRWSARRRLREWAVPLVALGIGALVTGLVTRQGLMAPDSMAQNYDNLFHLNAVQYILDTGSASPFDMRMASEATVFYPTLWHGVVANIVLLTDATIPLATNALILVVNALVWPVAAISLARALFGSGANVTLAAGVLSGAFSSFPYLLAPWTALYPNLLAIALMTICLAAAVRALGLGRNSREPAQGFRGALTATGAIGAACLAQPNTFFAAGLMLAPAALVAVVRLWRGGASLGARVLALVAFGVGAVAFSFAWSRVRTSDNFTEFDRGGLLGSFLDAVTNAPHLDVGAWTVTVLVLLGIAASLRLRRNRWWIVSYLVVIGLYTVAAGLPDSALRTLITQIWYNDAWRLAGFLPVGALPFAALGLATVLTLVQRGILSRRLAPRRRRRTAVIAATAIIALLGVTGTQGVSILRAVEAAQWIHDSDNGMPAVDDDEAALIDDLDDLVPEEAVIAGNPANGSSFAYALADREVLFPHFEGNSDPAAWVLAKHLKEGGPEVCAAADRLDVSYVLDFGSQFLPAPEFRVVKYPGLTDVAGSPILTEVAAVGHARLFEVTGCD